MQIVNRTPHPITILRPSGDLTIPAADRQNIARVRQDSRPMQHEPDDVPLLTGGWGSIVGLAPPRPGILQVVSVQVVLAAITEGRTIDDLVTPGDQVRDNSGRIIGCRGLTPGAESWPRATWQRLPLVGLFGSAARWLIDGGPPPADVDVAYVGLDPFAAAELVRDSLLWPRLEALRVPLDLHCTAALGSSASASALHFPQPCRLVGEHGDIPLDTDAVPIFGTLRVVPTTLTTLPAVLRRAARLLAPRPRGTYVAAAPTVAQVAEQVDATWPGRVDIASGDAGDAVRDEYSASSAGALRRAIGKLGERWPELSAALAERGRPMRTLEVIARGPICQEALAAMSSGRPGGGSGPTLRISRDGIGPVHGGPQFSRDAEAAAWLVGGVSD